MFKVMVQGKTREELVEALCEFMRMLTPGARVVVPETVEPSSEQPAEKSKRGRPKKVEESTVDQKPQEALTEQKEVPAQPSFDDPFATGTDTAAPATKTYTAEQVRAALMEFAKARTGDAPDAGAKRVYGLIQQFGYKNVKEIKPEHYAQIMVGTGLA